MTSISFTARYLAGATVSRVKADEKLKPVDVAIVELDKNDNSDMDALCEVAKSWNNRGKSYAYEVLCDATKGYEYDDVNREHYIALTSQKNDFEHLDADKVLGLTLFAETKKPENEICWLSVDPANNTKNKSGRKYKNIGSAIMNYLKTDYPEKPIYVQAISDAIPFYKKNGFEPRKIDRPCSLYLEV